MKKAPNITLHSAVLNMRVSGLHRSELAEAVVAAEAGEQRDGGVDHADGLGDHDRAAAEAGEPVPLAGVVALDAVGRLLSDERAALRGQRKRRLTRKVALRRRER